jgi:hypothetical protein
MIVPLKMSWGKIFVPVEEYIPPVEVEVNVGIDVVPLLRLLMHVRSLLVVVPALGGWMYV